MARLLLVEDEQVNREMFRRRLERKGYTVVPAESGLGAVELARTAAPDLILMDLGLPDIDGWEATRRVKADPASAAVPVIVLSAHATSDAREKAFAAGCQDFETKPVSWDVLFRKIEEWLAKAPPPPLAVPVAAPADAPTGKHPALPAAPPKAADKDVCAVVPKCVLVAEDNAANRAMLCRRLNARGFRTVEAADGREALIAVRRQPIDLVLCDVMMPVVDGYAVLQAMKEDPALEPIPIIMVSALDEAREVARCIELGAEDFLHKPYEPVLLYARVNASLDKRRLRDAELDYLRAVELLTRAAAEVEGGRFDPAGLAAVAAREDALGTLARVFDRMAREVQTRVARLQTDLRQATAAETDLRAAVREVARVSTADGFEKARRAAEDALARRPASPNPMTETMVMGRRPE